MRLNLQQRIGLSLLLPIALLLVVLGLMAAVFVQRAEHYSRANTATMAAGQFATNLSAMLQAVADAASHTAALAALKPDLSDAEFQDWLTAELVATPAVFGAGVTFLPANYGGRRKDLYVHRVEEGFRRMDQNDTYDGTDGTHEWFTLPQQTGKAVWTAPYFDAGAGEVWMVTRAVPFQRAGRFDGVALADVKVSELARLVAGQVQGDWVLLDTSGRIIYSSEPYQLGRPYTDWAPAGSERAELVVAALGGQGGPARVVAWPDGHARMAASTLVAQVGWILVTGQPTPDSILTGSHLPLLLLTLIGGGALLLSLAHWRLRRHMAPLRALADSVEQIVSSSTSRSREPLRQDEIGLLTRGLQELSAQLKGRDQHLVNRQRELGDRVREQQVLYRVADILSWSDIGFAEMLQRVSSLLPEAWPEPEQLSARINLAEFQSASEGFQESQRGLFAPIEVDGAASGGVWVFALGDGPAMEAGQQELIEGVAQQLGLAFRRERAQQQLEKLNRELEQRVDLRTQALHKAERLLRDITNSMPGAVYQVVMQPPRAAELRFVSAGVEAVFGVPRERALASYDALMGLVFPADLSELNAVVAEAVGRKQAFSHMHRITHAATGAVRWIRSAASTVSEPDGSVLLNGYWIDVTDQKELELALESSRIEADAANDAKSRFLANMSHEIRTPMNAIIGLTHLAVQQSHEPKVRDQLMRVEDSAKDLLGLLNDILDFSKIEAGRMTVERIPFDLWNVLDRVQSLMTNRAAEKGLVFNVWRVPELPRDLMGDPLRLHQVLLNLVSNAVKFTESGSVSLNVTIVRADDLSADLSFEVQDTGIGIDPIQMTRLFSAFSQADNTTTRRFGGTGLGLTICKELVTLMGGQISADSVPGTGSTFRVSLTLERADPVWRDDVPVNAGAQRIDPLIGARVLLVDDNFINLEVAGELLRQSRVEVVTASNGREALDRLAASEYDAVLMDLQMPVMDGLDATARIRANPEFENLPIIAMTANAMTGDRERCLDAGMNDHVPKPIDPDELRRVLARWLKRRNVGDLAATLPPMS